MHWYQIEGSWKQLKGMVLEELAEDGCKLAAEALEHSGEADREHTGRPQPATPHKRKAGGAE